VSPLTGKAKGTDNVLCVAVDLIVSHELLSRTLIKAKGTDNVLCVAGIDDYLLSERERDKREHLRTYLC
jgi:hypothetical protein